MGTPERDIRVMVVDDSASVREMISAILLSEPGINVVGTAANGKEAVAGASSLRPDLITMDIEMPVMGGLEAIERIMAEHPVPILVITSLTGVRTAFAAVSKGALDVIEKPEIDLTGRRSLIRKVRILARVDMAAHMASKGVRTGAASPVVGMRRSPPETGRASVPGLRVVAIASSTGGPQAIQAILAHLPANFPAPVVIAQHIAEGFTRGMAEWLGSSTRLRVREAVHGDTLMPGFVFINPAEFSMRITHQGKVVLEKAEQRRGYHPSCDTLLRSVADSCRERSLGLILSGMGDDGVEGITAISSAGGATLAQDEQSSVIYGMNRLAVERGRVDRVIPLCDIPAELMRLVGGKGK
ncbi:MAG: chemotaxis-specific protein-glutamate methyltransferase CheB [Desulfuromonadales bacterium]|nr:chemotaxis-specific protein-glutamate methyltransferase CheB [Desulfuromonadales bacterium]